MTQEKAQYLSIAKRNELISKQGQADAGTAAFGLGMMQSSGPYTNTPSVTCTTMGNATTCR